MLRKLFIFILNFLGIAYLVRVLYKYIFGCNPRRLIMAVTFKNIDTVPVNVVGAVDAEGAAVPLDNVSFAWTVENTVGDVGTIDVDVNDSSKALFVAGTAGSEGFVKVVANVDGVDIEGKSELIQLTASAPVSFTVGFGDPL